MCSCCPGARVCVHVCMLVFVSANAYVCVCMHGVEGAPAALWSVLAGVFIYVYMCVCIYVYIHICFTYIYTNIYVIISVCVCIHMYMYVCMCI
jgi:hypothetical protein